MNARSKIIVFLIFTAFISGCGNSNQFPLSETTGVVLCEWLPVPFVTVYFSPVREGEEIVRQNSPKRKSCKPSKSLKVKIILPSNFPSGQESPLPSLSNPNP